MASALEKTSQVKVINFNFKWIIDNFDYCWEETGEFIESPSFFSEECENLKWSLQCYPYGYDEKSEDYISIYLVLKSGNEPEMKANMKFSILNAEGKETNTTTILNTGFQCEEGTTQGVNKLISRDLLLKENSGLLTDKKLMILCEIDIVQKLSEPVNTDDDLNCLNSNRKSLKCLYKWSVPNFINSEDVDNVLESNTFCIPNNDKFKWFLRLYPKGICSEESISIFLYLESNNDVENVIKFNIEVQDSNEVQIYQNAMRPMKHTSIPTYYLHIPKDSLQIENENLNTEDKLIVLCDFEIPKDEKDFKLNDEILICEDLPHQCEDSDKYLFSDVTIQVGNHKYEAHKGILAAKSRVFDSIFSNVSEDANTDHIVISDVEHDIFQGILSYIYTEKVQNIQKIAQRLLVAAEKYELEKLKIQCEEVLGDNMVC